MENNQILKELQVIFRDVMDNDSIVINDSTTAADVEEWDSLSHLQLVFAVEKHFKFKFSTAELSSWKNVGQLVANISAKLNK